MGVDEPVPALGRVGRAVGVAEEGDAPIAVPDEVLRQAARGRSVLGADAVGGAVHRARQQHDRHAASLELLHDVVTDRLPEQHQAVDPVRQVEHLLPEAARPWVARMSTLWPSAADASS